MAIDLRLPVPPTSLSNGNQSPHMNGSGSSETEFIFMGTGTSSSLPHVDCLTAPPDAKKCKTCLSTLTPEGKKNIRRNTSGVIRMKSRSGPERKVTIVIDVGKTFQAAAVEWFPKYGLRNIDAVLITHAHADAMNGLDDLRGWTLGGAIQDHIDVYVSQDTFYEVQRSFPYLVSKEYASGGGDVPQFVWHIVEDQVPFEIKGTGIQVTPFSVHHGRIFSVPPAIKEKTLEQDIKLRDGLNALTRGIDRIDQLKNSSQKSYTEPTTPNGGCDTVENIQPYYSFGFRIEKSIIYLSDVSHIPEEVWPILKDTPVCILDCLHTRPHPSHFSLDASVAHARRIKSTKTYLTGFSHRISHEEYVTIGEAVGGKAFNTESLTEMEREGLGMVAEGEAIWIRPGHDGLRIIVNPDGSVIDETYA